MVVPLSRVDHLRVTHPSATFHLSEDKFLVRLACIRHTASVHPEPGSNSPYLKSFFAVLFLQNCSKVSLVLFSYFRLISLLCFCHFSIVKVLLALLVACFLKLALPCCKAADYTSSTLACQARFSTKKRLLLLLACFSFGSRIF